MIHTLKHMAIRIWLTVLLGGLAALAGLPSIQEPMGLEWAFALAVPVFVSMFFFIGWLFNRTGRHLVKRLIKEAAVWERAGGTRQAEKLLHKAVAVFDSFLISPFSKAKQASGLTGHMARFYLAQRETGPDAADIIQTYLRMRPQDKAVAEAWLQHLEKNNAYLKAHESLLYRIEKAQSNHAGIQASIARYYISAERTDFQALQTYRRLMESSQALDEDMIPPLAELLFRNKRTEAWILQIYLAAYQMDRKQRHFLQAMAGCLHWAPKTNFRSAAFKKARALLSGIDEATLEKMSLSFKPAEQPMAKRPSKPKANIFQSFLTALLPAVRAIAANIAAMPPRVVNILTITFQRIRNYPGLKPLLRWMAVGLAGIGLAILVVNTARHLMQSRQTLEEIKKPVMVEVTDPFTLQVAAYLKTEHAEKYVKQLKDLGLDAYWTVAQGAKRKWYQVRLSHFPDKSAARAYGESLKAKGIIDDFYVANYERP
jgi:sporulation related protein